MGQPVWLHETGAGTPAQQVRPQMKIAIGSDHFGFPLKGEIVAVLEERGIQYQDYGVGSGETIDYPEMAEKVACAVRTGEYDRGILICGTGIGMAIAANKVPGIRAAVAHDPYSAERARKSNNAQVLALGALVVGPKLARQLVGIWLDAEFQGGESARKVEKISRIERRFQTETVTP